LDELVFLRLLVLLFLFLLLIFSLGLGLFIVKKYADLLNFKVQIQSEINKGTKVYIIMKNIENLK